MNCCGLCLAASIKCLFLGSYNMAEDNKAVLDFLIIYFEIFGIISK